MKKIEFVICLLIFFLISGCASYRWVNRSAVNTFERDEYDCQREAEQIARQVARDREERSPTKCNAYSDGESNIYANCYKTSGYSSNGSAFLGGLSKGLEKSNNFRSCMRGRGWERVAVNSSNGESASSKTISSEVSSSSPVRKDAPKTIFVKDRIEQIKE